MGSKCSKCLVWRVEKGGPQTVHYRMWFQGGVVMLCIKVAWVFCTYSELSFRSYTHIPVSTSVVCWHSPDVRILKKLPRCSECPHSTHTHCRSKSSCDGTEKRKEKIELKDIKMIDASECGDISDMRGAAKG